MNENMNANMSMITRILNAYNELATFIIAIIICYMVADFMADVMFKKIEQLIIAKKNKDKIEEQRKIEEHNNMDQLIEELKQKDEDIAGLHMIIKLLNEQIVNMSNNNKPTDDICHRLWSDVLINDKQ
jgi:hypothetical protein